MAKLIVSLVTLLIFSFSSVCFGEELVFPFTVDQATKSEDITQLPIEKDIQTDKWFMSPPTRLELLTHVIDQFFKGDFKTIWELYKIEIEKFFEPQDRHFPVSASAVVRFDSDMDLFAAGVEIENWGKLKKPMKEICSEVLNSPIFSSLEGGGFSYHNAFLRPFIQKSPTDQEILRIVEKLRKNFLLSVTLINISFDKKQNNFPPDRYTMQCYKFTGEKEVHYRKQAVKPKR